MEQTPNIFMHSNVKERFKEIDFKPMFDAGFKPLAFTIIMLEDTFYFETEEEAIKAYSYFESGESASREYVGWWYGIKQIPYNNKYFVKELGIKEEPEIIYL